MDFEGRVLSNKKVVEAVTSKCVPVVTDNHKQVTENPRNKGLFDLSEPWGGLMWVMSPDRKFHQGIGEAGTVDEFIRKFDAACHRLEEEVSKAK